METPAQAYLTHIEDHIYNLTRIVNKFFSTNTPDKTWMNLRGGVLCP